MDVARHLIFQHTNSQHTNSQPFAVLAGQQLSGRGRLNGDWQSPVGNLYTTICFQPNLPPQHMALSSFAVVLALYDCVIELSEAKPDLKVKWPNDLLLGGEKIAGLLLECLSNNTLLIGLGVNLKSAPHLSDKAYKAADLSAHLDVSARDFLGVYLKHLSVWVGKLEREGFEGLRQTWLNRAYGIGQAARVRLAKEEIEGTILGIDQYGQLQLQLAQAHGHAPQIRSIAAGSVFF